MESKYILIIGLILGFCFDQLFGDPQKLPHPIVGFGKLISIGEKYLNKGKRLMLKGALMTLVLVLLVYFIAYVIINYTAEYSYMFKVLLIVIIVFYSLSARTLRKEVKMVFEALNRSVAEGRVQLSRIVGRDTSSLQPQQIRSAALETLAENLSDGVIAPLFWFALLGAPGMIAYKMINTLDSMIGYKSERYFYFGKFAAKLDDVANYLPARITAFIMLLVSNNTRKSVFVLQNAKFHSSPNSGYPEAALVAILDCRFGGPNYYFGKIVNKPFIGSNNRQFKNADVCKAALVNQFSEIVMLLFVIIKILI